MDPELNEDWLELADLAANAVAPEPCKPDDGPAPPVDDPRKDSRGYVTVPARPLPIGRVTTSREGQANAQAHISCYMHPKGHCASKWVSLRHLPDRTSLCDWLEAGVDKTAAEHFAAFYTVTKYQR